MLRKSSIILLGLIIIVVSTGCINKHFSLVGRTVTNSDLIDLKPNKAVNGEWKTNDLRILYNAEIKNNELVINGEGHFTRRIQNNFYFVKSFFIQVFFVDNKGSILASDNLSSAVNNTERMIDVKRVLPLPEETQAFTFGYHGEVFSTDGKDMNSLKIFRFPN